MTKILSVTNVKGGVGKSITALFFANILAEENNVLLIDLDSQNSLTSFFYENYDSIEDKTIYEVLLEKLDIKDVVKPIRSKLDFIPSNVSMRNLSVQFTNSRDYSLVYILKKIQNNYEYIVIDTPPNLNVETRLALVASNLIVIPTLLEKWAVRSIDIVLDYIEKEVFPLQQLAKIDLENILILPTLVEKNRKLQKIVLADLKEKYKIRVLEGIKRKVDVQKLSYIGCKNMLLEKVAAYNEYKEVLHNIIKRGD